MSVLEQFLPDVFQLLAFLLSIAFIRFHFFLAFVKSSLKSTAPVAIMFHVLLHKLLKSSSNNRITMSDYWHNTVITSLIFVLLRTLKVSFFLHSTALRSYTLVIKILIIIITTMNFDPEDTDVQLLNVQTFG